MAPTTAVKIKSALLIVAIHLTIAILVDLWLDMKLYVPLAAGGSIIYMQVLNNLKKKEQI